MLAVHTVPDDQTDKYGIAAVENFQDGLGKISSLVEKPSPSKAPSNLGVVGRYVLTPDVFDLLENIGKGAGGEIQLTDGIGQLLKIQNVFAYRFDGVRYDCGDKLGYLRATVELALAHPEFGVSFSNYLKELDLPSNGG